MTEVWTLLDVMFYIVEQWTMNLYNEEIQYSCQQVHTEYLPTEYVRTKWLIKTMHCDTSYSNSEKLQ